MKLSLAIINDNAALYLKRLFESLGNWRDSIDIIFVDNCSCDISIQIARDLGIKKIVTFKKKVVSRPILYNAAVSRIEGEYILYAHSDVIFGDGFFEKLNMRLGEPTGPDFINFRVMYVNKKTNAPSTVYWDTEGRRIKLSYHSLLGISDPSFKKLISCSESCFLVSSTVFKYEQFDQRYLDTFFVEDLLLKLEFQGASIIYDEDSYVEHYFLEEHERLRTLQHDIRLFIKNNLKELQVVNLAEKDRQISCLETSLQEKVVQINRLNSEINRLNSEINRLNFLIYQMQHSTPMQLAELYQRRVNRLLPRDTCRRRCYELWLTGVKVALNEGWRNLFRKVWNKLIRRRATE